MFMEGEFVDTVIGIPNSRSEIVMLRPPGGGTGLELSSFIRPNHEPGSPDSMSNELGLLSCESELGWAIDELQGGPRRGGPYRPRGFETRPDCQPKGSGGVARPH